MKQFKITKNGSKVGDAVKSQYVDQIVVLLPNNMQAHAIEVEHAVRAILGNGAVSAETISGLTVSKV